MTSSLACEPVIGLEVHAQLLTRSKMFCGCSAAYTTSAPNSHVCAVCGGMPGALPVINQRAIEMTIATALALNCRVPDTCKFDRKNYSYPDLPKGYQISQYDHPVGLEGSLDYALDGFRKRCGIIRVHLEEDTGKLIHLSEGGRDVSLIDYNRSGVPLMEIVSAPDLRSPDEAREFFVALRQILMYLGVNDGNLQEGSLRADVNVSLRAPDGAMGTKVEIKNLNSFRSVYRSLEYEIERQRRILSAGETLVQETRGWSETEEVTVAQRGKEYADDYRYFPEPDLPPIVVDASLRQRASAEVPELPAARSERLQRQYGLSEYMAHVLTAERALADFYEESLGAGAQSWPLAAAHWITGDLARLLHENSTSIQAARITPTSLAALVQLVEQGGISGRAGKTVLEEMFRTGEDPQPIVERENLGQITDLKTIERLVDDVIAANGSLVQTFLGGKTNALEALVGRAIGASRGRASPPLVRKAMIRRLEEMRQGVS